MNIVNIMKLPTLVALLCVSYCVNAVDIAPPPYNVTDRNYVNLASGQVSPSLTDVVIGGPMGLSHQISSNTSQFVNFDHPDGAFGFVDNYRGGLYTVLHSQSNEARCINQYYDITCRFFVLRAYGGGYSQDFEINDNGTYTPLSDTRYALELEAGRGYVLKTPDGAEVLYGSPTITEPFTNPFGYARFPMREIIKPNGHVTTIYRMASPANDNEYEIHVPLSSVVTNTGFQLKYVKDLDANSDTLPPEKQNADIEWDFPDNINADYWAHYNPHKVIGINRRYQFCGLDLTSVCAEEDWPKATYIWPDGMPKAMYIGESVFTVIDAAGRVTEYHHTAFDRTLTPSGEPVDPDEAGRHTTPRLSKIKPANADVPTVFYRYKNNGEPLYSGWMGMAWLVTKVGVVYEATRGDQEWTYAVGNDSIGGPNEFSLFYNYHQSAGYQAVSNAHTNGDYRKAVMYFAETWDKTYYLQDSLTNRLTTVGHKLGGGATRFKYDDHDDYIENYAQPRGNLVEMEHNGAVTTAIYPSSCNDANRKYCNQATSITDPRGQTTHYTYHPESGQVATITSPANDAGLVAQTRYSYQQYYARYRKNGDSLETETRGIWLPYRESQCANSNYVNGVCAGNDEVITTYEYDPYNLYKVGQLVSAKNSDGVAELRATCFEYDKFGNMIGEQGPRSGKTTCL